MTLPCLQTERIETAVDKLAETVSGIASDMRLLSATVDATLKKVDEQDTILKGDNGKPGMVAVVAKLNGCMDDLYGAMRGEKDKPGLIAAIDTLTKKIFEWEDTKKWISRLMIGWIVTTILGLLAVILKP